MKRLVLILALTLMPRPVRTQPMPPAAEVGELMANAMCQQLLETGSLQSNSQLYWQQAYESLVNRYGEATIQKLFNKLDSILKQPSTVAANDPYILAMFREVFRNLIEDDTCFRAFLANEVF